MQNKSEMYLFRRFVAFSNANKLLSTIGAGDKFRVHFCKRC